MLSSSGKALEFKAMARRYLDEARTAVELAKKSPTSGRARIQRAYLADLYTRLPLPEDDQAEAAFVCIRRIHSRFTDVDNLIDQKNLAMNPDRFDEMIESIHDQIRAVRPDIDLAAHIVKRLP